MANKKTEPVAAMNPNIVNNIKHVVVVVMENRSFDHIYGDFPEVNGINPLNPNLQAINVANQSQYFCNPGHDFLSMMSDIFGTGCTGYVSGQPLQGVAPSIPTPIVPAPTANMSGFEHTHGTKNVMSYFQYLPQGNPGRLNVLHSLAENYVVCDNWFCDTPSCTTSNRFFVHAATNRGYNDYNPATPTSDNTTTMFGANNIYQQLDRINPGSINWAHYGWPQASYDSELFGYCYNFPNQFAKNISDFSSDVASGNLPFYTFINPSLNNPGYPLVGNSMHPSSDIRLGENLIAQVYNTLVAHSDIWENTLLIITFDENGGFYDHVPPPSTVSPDGINYCPSSPDSASSTEGYPAYFDYSILGPRVPALLISPWLANPNVSKNTFQVDSSQYQNTSIPRFLQDLLQAQVNGNNQIGSYSLNSRDAIAQSFANSPHWQSSSQLSPIIITPYSTPIPAWGTPFQPNGNNWPPSNPGEYLTKPNESVLDFTREYMFFYPGHADSGKPLTQEFKTNLELATYIRERKQAARNYALKSSYSKSE
jgi:phospholipase C